MSRRPRSKGRPLGPHGAQFAHLPVLPGAVYLCQLSDGVVKVGYSNCVRGRLTLLSRQVAKQGVSILRVEVSFDPKAQWPAREAFAREQRAIRALAERATPVPGHREFFTGISFDDAMSLIWPELATPTPAEVAEKAV